MNDSQLDTALDTTLASSRRRTERQVAQWDTEAQLASALDKIQRQPTPYHATRRIGQQLRVPSRGPIPRWMMVSVGALAVAAAWFGLVSTGSHQTDPVVREYTTQVAQYATLDLPDGSRVTLAPASHLQFFLDASGQRSIVLHGQARFTVTHTADHPFTVTTGDVVTTVLGTEFDVKHYSRDASVEVAVLSGKVMSAGRRSSVTLTPGSIALVTDSTAIQNTDADLSNIVGWTNGRLAFTRVAVPAMLASIGRWYGYEFKLADSSLAKRHVSVELSVSDRAETLQLLRELLNVTARVQGNVVVLQPNRSSSAPPARQSERHHLQLSSEVGK